MSVDLTQCAERHEDVVLRRTELGVETPLGPLTVAGREDPGLEGRDQALVGSDRACDEAGLLGFADPDLRDLPFEPSFHRAGLGQETGARRQQVLVHHLALAPEIRLSRLPRLLASPMRC